MASSDSQRQIVAPEMSATMPRLRGLGRCRAREERLSGTPRRHGSSQARALTATTTSGGKDRGSASPGPLFEAGQALLEEAFAPFRHDLPAGVKAGGDLVVAESLAAISTILARMTSRYDDV